MLIANPVKQTNLNGMGFLCYTKSTYCSLDPNSRNFFFSRIKNWVQNYDICHGWNGVCHPLLNQQSIRIAREHTRLHPSTYTYIYMNKHTLRHLLRKRFRTLWFLCFIVALFAEFLLCLQRVAVVCSTRAHYVATATVAAAAAAAA